MLLKGYRVCQPGSSLFYLDVNGRSVEGFTFEGLPPGPFFVRSRFCTLGYIISLSWGYSWIITGLAPEFPLYVHKKPARLGPGPSYNLFIAIMLGPSLLLPIAPVRYL